MPATYAAAHAALAAATAADPSFAPHTLLDLGGGTGAALWAAAQTFTSLGSAIVLDRSQPALDVGRTLANTVSTPVLNSTIWTAGRLDTRKIRLPKADLVTLAYVLAELPPAQQHALVATAAQVGEMVAVVEPGTPAGYRRVLQARRVLIDGGFWILAPCPHDRTCPLLEGPAWCHFSVRLNCSGPHRRAKGAVLGHEDEKFSYVVASRKPTSSRPDRVIGRPRIRKGVVDLDLCAFDGAYPVRVSKKQGRVYRAAPRRPVGQHLGATSGLTRTSISNG